MKIIKKILLTVIPILTLLVACSNEQTFEDFFHSKMELKNEYDEEVNYSYSLVYQEQNVVHPNDAIAIFTENKLQGEQIFIAYFEQENGTWSWKQTRGAEWDTPVKWSSMHQVPYIYSGAINDVSIEEVYAGKEKAKIVDVEGDKRFWYAISNEKDVDVKINMEDGTQEVIAEIDEEMLKGWKKKKNE
ncbi:hypothetical protein [Cytobacillus sp. IB215316]|uniref:hypothetical protein n=1 Tax=Cytobacillus sp. IB215316 TaxID=3097354 RepID=UPI002A0D93DC|nr:hypothetical protein [Cytobacillus sp. IB215316]MDX8363492.1 hypothetical protein [Cytobacillus sp. IB215316]